MRLQSSKAEKDQLSKGTTITNQSINQPTNASLLTRSRHGF